MQICVRFEAKGGGEEKKTKRTIPVTDSKTISYCFFMNHYHETTVVTSETKSPEKKLLFFV